MEKYFSLKEDELEAQFMDCSLDPLGFDHEQHIRLAWIFISKYGSIQAAKKITTQLKKYVVAIDEVEIYNETLTVAAVKIVNHFMQRTESKEFQILMEEHPRLLIDFKGLISSHYSLDIYNNAEAKIKYIEPDLIPFDNF